ncbi:MAG: ATP-binding protein [Bacteroidetes bacterium]|nr:ATP-binding protein [Bacteroidota bacterium]
MIDRNMAKELKRLAKLFPVTTVTGPRQSGKTTLVKYVFPKLPYASLENPDDRQFAETDPNGFLSNYPNGAVFDEVQRVTTLFSYIQGLVDDNPKLKFILSGSQNFLLLAQISQSLAGRVGILKLLPFSMVELKRGKLLANTFETIAHMGFYPRIFDQNIPPGDFYPNYIQTYIERDVRQITQVNDLNSFQLFLRLCAGRAGQLLNLSDLANDASISVNTVKSWLSILEASYITFRLYPHHKNFNKRLIKMPKLYFHDVGLLSYLLNIRSPDQIKSHYMRGAIFENFIISDLIKNELHNGREPNFYFWRDHKGREIDLIIEKGKKLLPIEIKSGKTVSEDYFKGLEYWKNLSGDDYEPGIVIYGGDKDQKRSNSKLMSWRSLIGKSL